MTTIGECQFRLARVKTRRDHKADTLKRTHLPLSRIFRRFLVCSRLWIGFEGRTHGANLRFLRNAILRNRQLEILWLQHQGPRAAFETLDLKIQNLARHTLIVRSDPGDLKI